MIIIIIPKYIGFLEYLKIPDVTSFSTFLNSTGLTVVFDFINLTTGFIITRIPIDSITIENKVLYGTEIKSNLSEEK